MLYQGSDVIVFGLIFVGSSSSGGGDMHLLPEYLFSIPTDNTFIMNIIGTDNGRIFMAGKDGCLYEIVYQVNIFSLTTYRLFNIE